MKMHNNIIRIVEQLKHAHRVHHGLIWLSIVMLIFISLSDMQSQTKSRIVGSVKDAKSGEALIGVNIQLTDTHLGAVTDASGKYFIIAVPVGTYKLQASLLGYGKKIVTNVVVSADRVTTVDVQLEQSAIEVAPVIINATRDELHKEVSSTQMVTTSAQINEEAGIHEINSFLTTQPGISENNNGYLSIRGGSAEQTGTMVNGLSYNNAANGNSETSIPLSAIDQVSVLSGGFNAEYGNFRSGLINVTTKSGTIDGFHGTFSVSGTGEHGKRFGPDLNDPKTPLLAPYLDADVAFVGTTVAWQNDPYKRAQSNSFVGWNTKASDFNTGKTPDQQATPLDMYLLYSWLFMAVPDYEGLQRNGILDLYLDTPEKKELFEQQKSLFAQHARKETGRDLNIDAGFGGPIPFLSSMKGTFYISNVSQRQPYVIPVSRDLEEKYTTLLTIKTEPMNKATLTFNGMWKVQQGVSPISPAFGDFPDATRSGGFMPIDNYRSVIRRLDGSYTKYLFDPPFFPLLTQATVLGGVTLNYLFSNSTYAELSVNYLSIMDNSPSKGDNRDTATVLTHFGPFTVDEMPYGRWQFAGAHRIGGVNYSYDDPAIVGDFRWRGKEGDLYDNATTNRWSVKFDIASQLDTANYVKAGFEFNTFDIDNKIWERWNTTSPQKNFEFNYHRTPSQTGLYLQDQLTYNDMLANIGVRLDYWFGGGGKWPTGNPFSYDGFTWKPTNLSDSSFISQLQSGVSPVWNHWAEYDATHPGFLQPIKNHLTFSPRIGVSFPVTENSKLFFNYGHFRSNPPYYSMYLLRYRYDVTTGQNAGLYDLSNPNLEPPRTISYELGAGYNFYGPYILNISGYYKDVTGENGIINYTKGNPDSLLNYSNWASNVSRDIQGLEIALRKQDDDWITGAINFNYSLSKVDSTGFKTIAESNTTDLEDNMYAGSQTSSIPQPSVNATLTFRMPGYEGEGWKENILGGWVMTLFGEWTSGQYTTFDPANKTPRIRNNIHWPDYWMVNLKLNKSFKVGGGKATFYVDINNLFNFKVNLMGKMYAFDRAGSDYDDYLASLHLAMYDNPDYEALRASPTNAGKYIPGDDQPGDLRSADKPYINDPNYPYFEFGKPREIWAGIKLEF